MFLIFTTVLSWCLNLAADDWPQFLGPQRNGISAETELISELPEDGPKIVWRAKLGTGMSGVAVSDGTVYTLYQDEEQQYVVALDEKTGKEKWKTEVAPAFENAMGNGPRATPTVIDNTVCVFTGNGVLAALTVKKGKVKWKIDTLQDLSSRPADYGMSSSPLIVDGTVVVQAGSPNGNVVGYDLKSGKRNWVVDHGLSGYSSPVLMEIGGTKQIVAFVGAAVLGISPDGGKQLWKYNFETDYNCNTASPVQLDDSSLLISAGENHGSAILKPTKTGDDWKVEETWSSFGKDSVLRAEWQTPVLADGHLYGLDNVGSAGPITNLVCVKAADGKQVWSQPRFGKSNLTYADGKLFLSTIRGELAIVAATPEEFQETARAVVLEGMTRQAPVIANGRLYLRDDNEVVCIDVQKKK